jgi:membrane protease subunit HflC
MNKLFAIIVGAILLLLLVLFSTTYTVAYHQVAIKTKLGKAEGGEGAVVHDAGLKFKLPVPLEAVTTIDKRLQLLETAFEQVQTADDQQLVVRGFLMWRVDPDGTGPVDFFKSLRTPENANVQISQQLRSAMLAALGSYRFSDLIGSESRLDQAEKSILDALNANPKPGVIFETVGLSQVVLPPKTTNFVYRRMDATRQVQARLERQQGESAANAIRSAANEQADIILAFATSRAEDIKSKAYEEAGPLMERFKQDEDFAVFLVWLDGLKKSLGGFATIVLDSRLAPWHLLNMSTPIAANQIPQPQNDFISAHIRNRETQLAQPTGQSAPDEIGGAVRPLGSETDEHAQPPAGRDTNGGR